MTLNQKNNYLIKEKDLNKILSIGSNHPRRKKFFSKFVIKKDTESITIPKIVNVWKLRNFSKKLNIVVGDSHSEFITRYYKSIVDENVIPLNLSLAFWTGPTTLIGSILSSNYYDHLKTSLIQIIDSIRKFNSDLSCINIVISLGEIDVRTKIPLEVLKKEISFCEVIDQNINESYSIKLNSLKIDLENIFCDLNINIYFKIPSPPSDSEYKLPSNYKNALKIIKTNPFPKLGNIESRVEIYKYLINKIKWCCNLNNVKILENKSYYNKFILDKQNSHDGCHVSKGEWAFTNCNQLIKL